ncbi:hypothetical protein ACJX0J_019399, partial [Zea mays]
DLYTYVYGIYVFKIKERIQSEKNMPRRKGSAGWDGYAHDSTVFIHSLDHQNGLCALEGSHRIKCLHQDIIAGQTNAARPWLLKLMERGGQVIFFLLCSMWHTAKTCIYLALGPMREESPRYSKLKDETSFCSCYIYIHETRSQEQKMNCDIVHKNCQHITCSEFSFFFPIFLWTP